LGYTEYSVSMSFCLSVFLCLCVSVSLCLSVSISLSVFLSLSVIITGYLWDTQSTLLCTVAIHKLYKYRYEPRIKKYEVRNNRMKLRTVLSVAQKKYVVYSTTTTLRGFSSAKKKTKDHTIYLMPRCCTGFKKKRKTTQ
jgi:hypothetical protein